MRSAGFLKNTGKLCAWRWKFVGATVGGKGNFLCKYLKWKEKIAKYFELTFAHAVNISHSCRLNYTRTVFYWKPQLYYVKPWKIRLKITQKYDLILSPPTTVYTGNLQLDRISIFFIPFVYPSDWIFSHYPIDRVTRIAAAKPILQQLIMWNWQLRFAFCVFTIICT